MKRLFLILAVLSLFVVVSLGPALAAPPKKTPELLAQGKKIFAETCATCHGSNGDGKGPAGAALKPPPTDFRKPLKEWPNTQGDLQKIFDVISRGIPNSAMIAWTQFSEEQRWALAYTVMGFAGSSKAPAKKK